MIIKVCGLNNTQNLADISKLDIDMAGYNFYLPSPRYIDHILPDIPNNIKKVGVFVNASLDVILQKKELYKLDYAQLHGDENLSFVEEIQSFIPVIKVFRIDDDFNPAILKDFDFCDMFLFDTATKNFGGSGQKFNWNILKQYDIKIPFLLSGGIGPNDVDEILKMDHPHFKGIDINSKFEVRPGIKDVGMVKNFVSLIKNSSAARNPLSLKGRPTRFEDNAAELSPLGVGGKEEQKAELSLLQVRSEKGKKNKEKLSARDPLSQKGRPTRLEDNEAELSPLGVGGEVGQKIKKKKSARDPLSQKGRPTRLEDNATELSPLGVGGEKGSEDQLIYNMFYGATPIIFEKTAALRRNMTFEELKVWNFLKTKPGGYKFRRQHPINLYVADLYCHPLRLVIEIDGVNHQHTVASDSNREAIFKTLGIKTIRFTNNEVNTDFENVMNKIFQEILFHKKSQSIL